MILLISNQIDGSTCAMMLQLQQQQQQQVQQSGIELSRLSPELRDDREIVLASVRINGNSFGCASAELRSDKDLVIQAINNGASLQCVPQELRNDQTDAVAESGAGIIGLQSFYIYYSLFY